MLWPSLQRDFLLSLAVEGLYRPLWSSAILAELGRHEAIKRVARGATATSADTAARRLVERMRVSFDDACVEGWEPLEGMYGLPDPDDEHVIAAAVVGGAGAIVTSNIRDFPVEKLPSHVQVIPPDVFALDTVEISPARALHAVEVIATRFHHPPRTVDQLLGYLESKYKMAAAVNLMRSGR